MPPSNAPSDSDADAEEKKQPAETKACLSYDPASMSGSARYSLCISAVTPRPVAVISSVDPDTNVVNCAPFSYTSMSTHDPPIVTHGLCLSGGSKKDTLLNIEATGEWVFNALTEEYLDKANACSAGLARGESEVDHAGLTTAPSEVVAPPRIVESALSMECQLIDKKEIFNDSGAHTTTIVRGRVVRFHIRKDVLKEGRPEDRPTVDLDKVNTVGRAGDITYWPVGVKQGNKLAMTRPKYDLSMTSKLAKAAWGIISQKVGTPQHEPNCKTKSSSLGSTPSSLNEEEKTKEESQRDVADDFRSIDPNLLSGSACYSLCISAVTPRPIAVISSVNPKSNVVNCAPFSYTSISTHDPPIVTHGLCLAGGVKRDTLLNIEASGEWVFNVLTADYVEKANACSANLTRCTSEVDYAGLTTEPSEVVAPPRILESAVSMECKLVEKKEIYNDSGAHTTTIVMGRVVRFRIREDVLKDGRPEDSPVVDLDKVNTVGRAGDITFWPVGMAEGNKQAIARPK